MIRIRMKMLIRSEIKIILCVIMMILIMKMIRTLNDVSTFMDRLSSASLKKAMVGAGKASTSHCNTAVN